MPKTGGFGVSRRKKFFHKRGTNFFSRKFFSRFFFSKKKNRRQLKKLEIWVGGSKAISEGVGVILNARGVIKIFLEGVAPP